MTAIKIPYSDEQANAFVDSCLYGMPYGYEGGEHEYIRKWLDAQGYKGRIIKTQKMDDKNAEHLIELED